MDLHVNGRRGRTTPSREKYDMLAMPATSVIRAVYVSAASVQMQQGILFWDLDALLCNRLLLYPSVAEVSSCE
jgi:hypothetical protein